MLCVDVQVVVMGYKSSAMRCGSYLMAVVAELETTSSENETKDNVDYYKFNKLYIF